METMTDAAGSTRQIAAVIVKPGFLSDTLSYQGLTIQIELPKTFAQIGYVLDRDAFEEG
jgi:hypothetical protein